MQEIENEVLLLEAAKEMDRISKKYCVSTSCNDERMKSVDSETNCEWYHGSWLYCRIAGIIVTNDYLGESYSTFFDTCKSEKISILLCGLADYAPLAHLLRRIPDTLIERITIYVIDICNSPLELCKWYLLTFDEFRKFTNRVFFVQADATNLPFADETFDMITSLSFLTRMVFSESKKVCNEWRRVLKNKGEILTTIHVTKNEIEGDFYRSKNGNEENAIRKVEEYAISTRLSKPELLFYKQKVNKYIKNIMSSALSENNVEELFQSYKFSYTGFEQPGELESIHRMILLKAIKIV